MDAAVIGSCRVDYCRIDVFDPIWDNMIEHLSSYQAPSGEPVTPPYEYPLAVFDETDFDYCVF